MIGIVGTVGSAAFSPNPAPAEVGNLVVWTNNDAAPHRIVLGDGTVVGDVAPGASTAPVPLTAASMEYHCTIHPSMVGTLGVPAATPPPYVPPPDYGPPPGYGYGYDY
jgi:plastocyanin